MKKKNVIVTAVILLAAAAAGGGYYYRQQNMQINPADIYQIYTVGRDSVSHRVSGTGNVEAKDSVSLYLSTSQTVAKVNVREGDRVKVGDVLVEYDTEQDMADLNRKLSEAQIQLQNARLNLKSIEQSADGNELVQYYSDITTAQRNVTDAQSDIISAQKNVTDAQGDIASIEIRIAQQQLVVDDAKAAVDKYEILLAGDAISQKVYDDSVTMYKNAQESLNDLLLQKEIKEKTLETRILQEENANQKLETRLVQEEYANQKLDNALNRLSDESTAIQYSLQQNIISLNQLTIEQIQADMEKLAPQSESPIDGNITVVNVSEGGIASKGVPVVTLSDTSQIIVRFEVSEYDAPLIELGQRAYVSTSALPDREYMGTVTKIAEEAIEKEDSSDNEIVVPVEITIENTDEKIKIGYSVDVEILIEEAEDVVAVPVKALVKQGDVYYVYVIRDNMLEKTEVSVGLYGDRAVEITDGVSEEDVIVLDPEDV